MDFDPEDDDLNDMVIDTLGLQNFAIRYGGLIAIGLWLFLFFTGSL